MTYYPAAPPASPAPLVPPPARRWPKRLLITFLVVANLGIFGTLGAVWYAAHRVSGAVSTLDVAGLTESAALGDPRTFLLVGSDSRQDLPDDWVGYGDYGGQRADVVILVQVLPGEGKVQMLSIPRDTKVTINGETNRINAFFGASDPDARAAQIVEAVSQWFDVPIHHYLAVDFAGFAGIVDAVGGIEMNFPYAARDRKSKLDVPAGTRVLDGRTALALARSRNYQEFRNGEWVYVDASDIGRTRRQQEVLMALLTQIERPSSLNGFKDLVNSLGQFVTADEGFGADEIIQLAWDLRSLGAGDLDSLTLPVDISEEGGVSYVVAHEPDASTALAAFRAGEPLTAAIAEKGRVEVQNGNGVSGSAASVAERLRGGGWEVAGTTNSGREDYATTVVVARARNLPQAEAVATFLGFGQVEQGAVPRGTDVLVIVGADAVGS